MKFTQTGTFQKNTLEKIIDINPLEKIHEVMLDKLNYFVGFIAKKQPGIIADYVANLTKKYQGLIVVDFWKNVSEDTKKIFTKYEHLTPFPNLSKASLNYYLHLLQVKDTSVWETTEIKTSMKALIQAWTFPAYYFLQTLTETIDRKDAIKLFKQYITHYYLDHPYPDREQFSLEKRLADRTSGDITSSEWVIVHTMLEDGKYAFKNKNCPTCVDTMKDLPDVELKYYVACYGDYEKFRAFNSEHIILTMEHTLMQGDPYCSRVMHDTRIDYDLRHPPKKFWDNLEPGKEEEAKKYYKK